MFKWTEGWSLLLLLVLAIACLSGAIFFASKIGKDKPQERPFNVCKRIISYEDGSVICVLRQADNQSGVIRGFSKPNPSGDTYVQETYLAQQTTLHGNFLQPVENLGY